MSDSAWLSSSIHQHFGNIDDPRVEGRCAHQLDPSQLEAPMTEGIVSSRSIVSAWSTEHRLVLGQTPVDAESNEITAIPSP